MREIAESHGIAHATYLNRLSRGWDKERAATESVQHNKRPRDSYYRAALKNGISEDNYFYRLRGGWSKERASTEKVAKKMPPDKEQEIAVKNGISPKNYRNRVNLGWTKKRASTQPVKKKYEGEIAVYVGGKMVSIGSVAECAEETGYKETYINWLMSPTAERLSDKKKNPEVAPAVVKLDE